MVVPVRYRPARILHWLDLGAKSLRAPVPAAESLRGQVTRALSKALDAGKSAVADVSGFAIRRLEYRLYDDRLEVDGGPTIKSVPYSEIQEIQTLKRQAHRLVLRRGGSVVVKPYAWLVVSSVRMPLGWERNGAEVPFETLIEELEARTKAPRVAGG